MSWLEEEKKRRRRKKQKEIHEKWREGGEMERKLWIFLFKLLFKLMILMIPMGVVIWISLMILDWLK